MQEELMKISTRRITPDEDLLNSNDVSEMLGVSVNTLGIWRHQGKGPSYLKFSRRAVRYRKQDVLDWMEEATIETEKI